MTATHVECQVLTLAQAGEVLGVSARTLLRLVQAGEPIAPGVEAFKVGSQWRVSRTLLERYLAGEGTSEATSIMNRAVLAAHRPASNGP